MSIFVSYSRLDETAVKVLARGLEAADREVWFDDDLNGGEVWWVKILQSILQADVVMFGLSDHSLRSKPCRAELDYAMALDRAILPIQVGPVANFRANPLSALQTLRFRPDDAYTAFEIIGAVDDAVRRTRPLPDPLPPEPQMPYAYLAQLNQQIDTEQLSPQVQIDAVDELRKAFRNEIDESVQGNIKEILQRLRTKPWIAMQTAEEVDDVLAWIERQQSVRRRGTPGGGGSGRPDEVPATPADRRPPSSPDPEVAEEDARRKQFEQRLAQQISDEQAAAAHRREERKRAAAEKIPARSGAAAAQRSPMTEQKKSERDYAQRSAQATETKRPDSGSSDSPGGEGPTADPPDWKQVPGPGGSPPASSGAGTTAVSVAETGSTADRRPFQLNQPSLPPPDVPSWPGVARTRTAPAVSEPGGRSAQTPATPSPATASQASSHPAHQAGRANVSSAGPWSTVHSSPTTRPQASGTSLPRPNWGWCVAALPTVVFGLVALYWAAQVNPRLGRGDVAGARRASDYARGWGSAGLVLGIVLLFVLLPKL